MNGIIVIPARLASTRLPRKLLLNETGQTVLEHTYRACLAAQKVRQIVVAVDHEELYQTVLGFGGNAVYTDPNAQSGTDRVAEVARLREDVSVFINVQGDEPQIAGSSIDLVYQLLEQYPDADVATLATPIRTRAALEDPSCVKVVRSHDGRALYFSRSVIPHPRTWDDALLGRSDKPLFLQHLGIYGYRRSFLLELDRLPQSDLEQTEKLEQLRFLEAGKSIVVGIVEHSARGIDTREDYEAFKARISQK